MMMMGALSILLAIAPVALPRPPQPPTNCKVYLVEIGVWCDICFIPGGFKILHCVAPGEAKR